MKKPDISPLVNYLVDCGYKIIHDKQDDVCILNHTNTRLPQVVLPRNTNFRDYNECLESALLNLHDTKQERFSLITLCDKLYEEKY